MIRELVTKLKVPEEYYEPMIKSLESTDLEDLSVRGLESFIKAVIVEFVGYVSWDKEQYGDPYCSTGLGVERKE